MQGLVNGVRHGEGGGLPFQEARLGIKTHQPLNRPQDAYQRTHRSHHQEAADILLNLEHLHLHGILRHGPELFTPQSGMRQHGGNHTGRRARQNGSLMPGFIRLSGIHQLGNAP